MPTLPSPTTPARPFKQPPIEASESSIPSSNINNTPRRLDTPAAVPFLDPRKLIKADSFPVSSPRSTLDYYPIANGPSLHYAKDWESASTIPIAPRMGNIYDPSAKRANPTGEVTSKPIRLARRTNPRHAGRDNGSRNQHTGYAALSIESRLARHFPCRLPPAPAPSTRRVSNLVAVPPMTAVRRTAPDEKQDGLSQVNFGPEKDEMELGDIASSSLLSARESGRPDASRDWRANDGSKDGELGSESDWEGLEMGFWEHG